MRWWSIPVSNPLEDKRDGEWHEKGSDARMDIKVLARVITEGQVADLKRERKIVRRAE